MRRSMTPMAMTIDGENEGKLLAPGYIFLEYTWIW